MERISTDERDDVVTGDFKAALDGVVVTSETRDTDEAGEPILGVNTVAKVRRRDETTSLNLQ